MLESILLYSKESPSNSVRAVQGHSGKIYGHARFSSDLRVAGGKPFSAMVLRFKPEAFTQSMAEDIVANMHRSFCKWVFWPEMKSAQGAKVPEVALSPKAPILPEEAEESIPLVASPLSSLPPVTDSPKPADPYAGKNFRQLRSMAKERGVPNVESITKSADLIDAMKAL